MTHDFRPNLHRGSCFSCITIPLWPPSHLLGVGWGRFQKGIPCYGLDRGWEEEGGEEEEEPVAMLVESRRRMEQKTGRSQAKTQRLQATVQCLTFHHACCLRPQTHTTTNPSQGISLSVVPVTVSGNNFPLKTGLM